MVKNGESIVKLLPKTIERLKSLEGIHNKGKLNEYPLNTLEL